MSGKYIKREAAISKLRLVEIREASINFPSAMLSELKSIPAADVVEVVRCKDCIYWRGENDLCKGICIDFDADGYCSEGKRKGGQDDV